MSCCRGDWTRRRVEEMKQERERRLTSPRGHAVLWWRVEKSGKASEGLDHTQNFSESETIVLSACLADREPAPNSSNLSPAARRDEKVFVVARFDTKHTQMTPSPHTRVKQSPLLLERETPLEVDCEARGAVSEACGQEREAETHHKRSCRRR